ncbi:hypothetical protein, partial [Bartonella sp. MR168JLCBS]|uniref:hypothetical protein n=1 Tax=Bartonella sp. MR168JLCBS TaxID=3243556 RepID=UPI0035D0D897
MAVQLAQHEFVLQVEQPPAMALISKIRTITLPVEVAKTNPLADRLVHEESLLTRSPKGSYLRASM